MAVLRRRLLLFLVSCAGIYAVSAVTDPGDATVLQSLKGQWQNTPPSWRKSDDPCDGSWDGITCNNSRVTTLHLSSMGLKGTLSGDIGGLTELRTMDLSFNPGLTGSLSSELGKLIKLNILILAGCGFTGGIPDELGNLSELLYLALNSNNFSGGIPPSLGNLSKLYWFDLADNQLTGSIPVSTPSTPGLDLLLKAKHFHFNKNQLSGPIPPELFRSEMILIHVLFDSNQLNGSIPSSLGLVKTLEVLRLDRNHLTGTVPSNLNNLTKIKELNLALNELSGPLPNLTGMDSLCYVDLSHNNFDESEAPDWFSTLQSLTTLVIKYGSLSGPVPQEMFSFPDIQQVNLKNNSFNGTLAFDDSIGHQLQLVDLQNNDISAVTLGSSYTHTLILIGNPICTSSEELSVTRDCRPQQQATPYSTSLAHCGGKTCSEDQKPSPQSCECAYPYEGILYFRAPFFSELSNATVFESLESSLWTKLDLTPGSVSLQNPFFNSDDYLQVHLGLFPSMGMYFSRSEILKIGFDLSNQTYKPPQIFGPYFFIPLAYVFQDNHHQSVSSGLIIGIAIAAALFVLVLLGIGMYAIWQKRRADKAVELSNPFASWAASGKDSGGAPQLKGARWFSYDELRKCTSNFSDSNVIGSGGYGKVYRGILCDGLLIAIKRSQQGSMQGGLEFKNEIELLSRVHHKNLVSLIGFCFEQREQMLVYEFMANGSLRDALSGRSGIYLDWKRRLQIALGSARGLAYLHELANPPIIHRDVKSSNILLDEKLSAKVADFGLSKLVSDGDKGHVSTQVKGTLGYLDPEYYLTQQLTEKSDVYGFGVIMLELLIAKQPIEKGKYIVREVKVAMNAKDEDFYGLREMIDPAIKSMLSGTGLGKFLEVALQCLEESANDRPTMGEVVRSIETVLRNDGIGTNSTSSCSSATDISSSKAAAKHPYDAMQQRDASDQSEAFDSSGGYLTATIKPV